MAVRPRLNARTPYRFAAVAALVVLAHALALQWLGSALESPARLKQMATPMFTRLLQQEAPAAAPVTAAGTGAPRGPAITSVAKAPRPARAASKSAERVAQDEPPAAPPPEAAASTPTLPEATVAQAPPPAAPAAEPASAPAPAASAPLAAASAPLRLDTWPADTRLSYRLSGWFRGELYGSARVQWQREQARYQARIEIDVTPFASLTLTSQGEVTAQGLAPHAYEEVRSARARSVRVTEDAVVLGDGRRLPRPAGVQDTASQFVELGHRFATGQEKLEVGRSVQVWLARPGGVDQWTYDIAGREVLQSPEFGAIDTFHLKPRPITRPRGNITAEMWYAPTLQYLPVRIRISMGQDTWVDVMVEKIEQR